MNIYDAEIQDSVEFLGGDLASKMLEADAYWPKWNSPWWHMLLLYEMGEAKQIPSSIIEQYIASLNRVAVKIFPIHPGELPEGVDPYRGTLCHCQLGNAYQVLAACGVDVDSQLSWIRPWLLRYQMADGGMTCDNDAYLVKDEVPSSMVGTIAAFEAILLYTNRPWTEQEETFIQKGAEFLIGRKLLHGSDTKYNASERVSAEKWKMLCFPRFYLYDVLRGLNALVQWSTKTNQQLPSDSIQDVIAYIAARFSEGGLKNERQSYEGVGTMLQAETGEWQRRQPATFFPLLTKVSAVGEVSPFLSMQWKQIRKVLLS